MKTLGCEFMMDLQTSVCASIFITVYLKIGDVPLGVLSVGRGEFFTDA